jgi:hypothetical protein
LKFHVGGMVELPGIKFVKIINIDFYLKCVDSFHTTVFFLFVLLLFFIIICNKPLTIIMTLMYLLKSLVASIDFHRPDLQLIPAINPPPLNPPPKFFYCM